ncbi:MAG: hypothetical protein U0670_22695 [Anaerolineae bacterium]
MLRWLILSCLIFAVRQTGDQIVRTSTSPDGQWEVTIVYVPPESPTGLGGYAVFSENMTTHQRLQLGDLPRRLMAVSEPYFGEWVSNTQFAIRVDGPESFSGSLYIADASQENSVETMQGWVYDFREQPPRYEYLETDALIRWKTGTFTAFHHACSLALYDAFGLRQFLLGYDCAGSTSMYGDCQPLHYLGEANRFRNGRDRYIYLRFDAPPEASSMIRMIDAVTGAQTPLLSGEIEAIADMTVHEYGGISLYIYMGGSGQIDMADADCVVDFERLTDLELCTVNLSFNNQADQAHASIQWIEESTITADGAPLTIRAYPSVRVQSFLC